VSASDAVAEPDVVTAPAPPGQVRRVATTRRRLGPWVELFLTVTLALAGAWAVQRWIVKPFHVPTGSMEPTLLVGDRVLVSRFLYRLHGPERGDVAVFHPPVSTGRGPG
jgi:signal peptidase I